MCTLTFIPLENNNYLFTSSRDESINREQALPFHQYLVNNQLLYFPKDQRAGGTWFATTGNERTVCLLNGGFEPHVFVPNQRYTKSRGLVVLDVFLFTNFESFCANYLLEGIEPFTMISVEKKEQLLKVQEFRWTGVKGVLSEVSHNEPAIWSSVTLYSEEVIKAREQWFVNWLTKNSMLHQEDLLDFHRFAGNGNPKENVLFEAGEKRTLSICSLHVDSGISKAVYMNILSNTTNNYIVYH